MTDSIAKKTILGLWRDVEMFSVTNAPRPSEEAGKKVAVFRVGDRLPWMEGHPGHLKPNDREVWFHRVFIGIANKRDAVRGIVDGICGEGSMLEDELDGLHGRCWGFTLLLDWHGRLLRESYEPASFAMAGVLLRQGKSLAEATAQIDARKMTFLSAYPADEDASLDPVPPREQKPLPGVEHWAREVDMPGRPGAAGLKPKSVAPPKPDDEDETSFTIGRDPMGWDDFLRDLRVRSLLFGDSCEDEPDIIVESSCAPRAKYDAKKRVRQEIPDSSFMNSFYLRDLGRLAHPETAIPDGPLSAYLGAASAPAARVDILQDIEALIHVTRPTRMGAGRWPKPIGQPLMLAQQAAVGEALYGAGPLIAINGPPGTGKSTLLRDVIADIVVQRARAIAALSFPAQAFTREAFYHGEQKVSVWNPAIVDGFGVVVTSSNNTAVENISKELPAATSIAADHFRDAGYLAPVASLMQEGAWGLMAATLGNRKNCRQFFRSVMPFRGDQEMKPGRSALGDHLFGQREREAAAWAGRKAQVLELHGRVMQAIQAMHEDFVGLRENPWRTRRKDHGMTRPDAEFRALDPAARQLTSLWIDDDLEELRTRLFLASLRLIEATLAANAPAVMGNMRAAQAILAKSGSPPAGPAIRAQIWNTIFAVTPVVSTTLASFERLFTGMGDGSLGWLLVDEAGQAVPQSLAGALARSRRAVIIGDPLQVEPVQTIPAAMIEKLREMAGVDAAFSPATASAQTVADRTMRVGGMIAMPEGEPIWTGMPLRAHRRCAEPMFSISNQISYAGQMVQAGDRPTRLHSILGASSWTDIAGEGGSGHVVREEMAELERVLRLLKKSWPLKDGKEATIFIITPFRRVSDSVNRLLKRLGLDDRLAAGTVHQFQGQEADIVLLVLGSAPGTAGYGARAWASTRSNLLNVALTRARSRIHVIGSYADWSRHAFFGELAQRMMRANRVLERETEAA